MAGKEITVAIAGNPNSGKSTVFNNLTGHRQHVGNWPGVTVEKREGTLSYQKYDINVVDLPGVYGLTAYSPDEVVARNFIVDEKPDVVVDVVDASNLERNLYLTVQLIELEANLVIALNMTDIAESRQHKINFDRLSELLNTPVIPMVASRKRGTEELLKKIVGAFENRNNKETTKPYYGSELEGHINELETIISRDEKLSHQYPPRWLAIKLLEDDKEVTSKLTQP